ncbi:Protein kinase family protein [Frankia canadensis]|uniref:non-specific serine/threonine protein kinase n=1 Tax=Frankia canadensis TaxID=1836972 RepID=A0A2I2KUX8_9ACTN|nr:serine/threonine-protein kinase [Frankia canadensis]SNQ49477.1 Protein kinase family protein [Frankia canadensis]SOU56767.1 Protein kinase family protein [Frankia canadensis]
MLTPLVDDDPRQVGPFAIHNRIGAGGMGTVYLGFNAEGRAAAVKVPDARFSDDPEFRERFRREVAAARRVHGRAVAAVLDADPEAASPWLATEYVEGTSLADAVLRHGRMEERLLHGFGVGLADALIAIHAAGVVHRDLKPSNILLAWDGPKVIDFGIARATGVPSHTRTGILIGTLAWMAPEQLRGERAGPPADIFAWGACVTYAATGHPPFASEEADVLTRMREDRPPDIVGVPDALVPLVRAALARRPQDRPSAADLVRRLVADPQVRTPADADRVAAQALTPWQARPPLGSLDEAAAGLDPDRPDQPTHPLALRPTPPPGGDRSVGTMPVPRWAGPEGDNPPGVAGAAPAAPRPRGVPTPATERTEPRGGAVATRLAPAAVALARGAAPGRVNPGGRGAGADLDGALLDDDRSAEAGRPAGGGLLEDDGHLADGGPRQGAGPRQGGGPRRDSGSGRPGVAGWGSAALEATFGWLPAPWRRAAPLASGALLVMLVAGIVAAVLASSGGGSEPQVEPTPTPAQDRTPAGTYPPPPGPGTDMPWIPGGVAHGTAAPPPTAGSPRGGSQPETPEGDPTPLTPSPQPGTVEPTPTSTERPSPTSGASPTGGPTPSPTGSAQAPPTGCPTAAPNGPGTPPPPVC